MKISYNWLKEFLSIDLEAEKVAEILTDLGLEDVWIVDPDLVQNDAGSDIAAAKNEVVCDVGVESTVAKVEMVSETSGIVSILRHGAVSSMEIMACLEAADLSRHFEVKEKMQSTGENVSHVAPGQTIRHYSPNVQSFMISHERYSRGLENGLGEGELKCLESAVIIDIKMVREYRRSSASLLSRDYH